MLPDQHDASVAALEKDGEAVVRAQWESGRWKDGTPTRRVVLEWLKQKEIDREVGGFEVAKRAAEASERSAKAAERSEKLAQWAIAVSLVAIVVTLVIWYRSL